MLKPGCREVPAGHNRYFEGFSGIDVVTEVQKTFDDFEILDCSKKGAAGQCRIFKPPGGLECFNPFFSR